MILFPEFEEHRLPSGRKNPNGVALDQLDVKGGGGTSLIKLRGAEEMRKFEMVLSLFSFRGF